MNKKLLVLFLLVTLYANFGSSQKVMVNGDLSSSEKDISISSEEKNVFSSEDLSESKGQKRALSKLSAIKTYIKISGRG